LSDGSFAKDERKKEKCPARNFLFQSYHHALIEDVNNYTEACKNMRKVRVHKQTLDFLKAIAKNNDRDWFKDHRTEYEQAYGNMADFADALIEDLNSHDKISTASGKKALFRVYRDVRFSKVKIPYTIWISASFKRSTALLRGSYYLRIQPNGNSVLGGGFWGPDKDDLQRIREQISADAEPLRKVLRSKAFKTNFGELKEKSLKTYPRGFDPEDPEIDLLRMRGFLVTKSFPDQEILSEDFAKKVAAAFKAMRPLFNVMSLYLTTDLNGEPLKNIKES